MLNMCNGQKVCKKVLRLLLDAVDNPDSHKNLIITF